MLIEKLDSFAAAPFTIQRISELLSDPRKQYSRIDKFMRAVEKTILVVSTVPPGRHRSESENGDSLDSALNGDFTSEVNVDIDMEQDGSFVVTKESSVTTIRKEENHEVSTANHETITIKKNAESPSKDSEAGTSADKIKEAENGKDDEGADTAGTINVTIENSTVSIIAVIEPKLLEEEPKTKSDEQSVIKESSAEISQIEEEVVKPEISIAEEIVETAVSEPKIDDALLNEPIRSEENEILVDTAELISETTPLAALENIVAIRTELVVVEPVEQQIISINPEPETKAEEIVEAPSAAPEDEPETEAKRLKIEDVPAEPPVLTEAIILAELPAAEEEENLEEKPQPADANSETPDELPTAAASSVEAIDSVVASAESIAEEKIDEPLAEIPIVSVPLDDIAETPATEMETVPTLTENTMSLDEDEPPALELEMTPIANKMDTDEAEAAPMDFEDDAEPMDQ